MTHLLRSSLANRLAEAAQSAPCKAALPIWTDQTELLAWCVRFRSVTKRSDVSGGQAVVSFQNLSDCGLLGDIGTEQIANLAPDIVRHCAVDAAIERVSVNKYGFAAVLNPGLLAQVVLSSVKDQGHHYGHSSALYGLAAAKNLPDVRGLKTGQSVVVDFSSPNIAKQFHAGHLRSTILGNFVSNICEWFGQRVTRVNYLGDWGTQFGLLGVGFKKYGDTDSLRSDPISHLSDVYVRINQECIADKTVHEKALKYFHLMEQDDEEAMEFWRGCRELSIKEYSAMYKRLGVWFSHIHGESMYRQAAGQLVKDLASTGRLLTNSKTGVGYIDLTVTGDKSAVHASLMKSDGTTLYLTRDIAAALDRQATFNADKLYYVVENGQHQHFVHVSRALQALGQTSAQGGPPLVEHVKFGRVEGMSTRRGEVVLLRDILDEARALALQTMRSKATTKETSNVESVAECVGVSAVIVQDLKEYRLNNYRFSWERMLNMHGDTGTFLQYTHARLHSLISGEGEVLSKVEVDYSLLTEHSAQRLVLHFARFDEVLLRSYTELEPCHLVQYLFMLGRLVNVCHDELYIRGQPKEIAKARLVLFESAKTVLSIGLRIIGITPLNRL